MSCSAGCGPKPNCLSSLAQVKTTRVPSTPRHLSPQEQAFWDPQIDNFRLASCQECQGKKTNYMVPRFFWSPDYDSQAKGGAVTCSCTEPKCQGNAFIRRRFEQLQIPK